MKRIFRPFTIFLIAMSLLNLTSCEKPTSQLKIFVRDSSGNPVPGAEVKIISSTTSVPATSKHSDKQQTNASSYCTFDLTTFFKSQISTSRDGYFDIIAEKGGFTAIGTVRATYQTTQVQTVKFPENK
jgi:hypothetical protein